MEQEIKAPEVGPNADALTSLTRGRGPRRGNLEQLLKYWRPIMKKPGGFRRCVVILADKPQFGGKPQRICAWLHHELTGKWPNEGKGKRGKGKRRGRSVTRTARRTARRAKAFNGSSNSVKVSALRLAVRESREANGLLTQPINGRQNVVNYKAAMFKSLSTRVEVPASVVVDDNTIQEKRVGLFGSSSRLGQAAQAVGSIAIPGDLSDIRSPVRSAVFEALTPGIPGRPGGGGLRRLGRAGSGARNKFRCPPGFEKGGTFTNAEFSTCGAQVLRIPGTGPGSFAPNVERQLARLSQSADLVRSIGDLRKNKRSVDIIRAAQIPTAPKKTNRTMTKKSTDYIRERLAAGDNFSNRFVRRDGVILEPSLSISAIGRLDEFDDMVDGVFFVTAPEGTFGRNEVPIFKTGLREVVYNIPEVGTVSLRKVGGDLSDTEKSSLPELIQDASTDAGDLPDPTAFLRSFAEKSDGRFEIEFGTTEGETYTPASEKAQERITVESDDQTIIVPRWVYETYLSRTAPRRLESDPVYEIVEKKSMNPFILNKGRSF